MLDQIRKQANTAISELFEEAKPEKGEIFVLGCSSSEITGYNIGTHSSFDAAKAVLEGIKPVIEKYEIYLAAQCCEHLNRCVILENEAVIKYNLEPVNVVPQPKAGGSMATAVFEYFKRPAAVEIVKASLGIDIGGTLIGMQLRHVAVPVKLSINKIGEANIVCARTRPKFIGGERAVYNNSLL